MKPHYLIATILFTLVTLLSFSCWAFGGRLFPTELILYIACAVVFLGLGGAALLPGTSLRGRAAVRFCLRFALAFLAYATCWTIAWFAMRVTFGEIIGSAVGLLVLVAILRADLPGSMALIPATAIVFFYHTIGYYAGGFAYASLQGRGPLGVDLDLDPTTIRHLARLSWGLGYGLGFGGGIQSMFYYARKSSESPSTQI